MYSREGGSCMKKKNNNTQSQNTQGMQQPYGYPQQGYGYGYGQPYGYGYGQQGYGYGYPQQPANNEPLYVIKYSAWKVIRFKYFLPMILAIVLTVLAHVFVPNLPPMVFYALYALTALCVIIPMVIMIFRIINIKDDQILIYPNKVVRKWGIVQKHEDTNIFTAILAVTAHQTLRGRIFNYGSLKVDVMGKWDIDTRGIMDPFKARDFLEQFSANGMNMQQVIMN